MRISTDEFFSGEQAGYKQVASCDITYSRMDQVKFVEDSL